MPLLVPTPPSSRPSPLNSLFPPSAPLPLHLLLSFHRLLG
ncbi:hypothetical protein TorRG33x02_035590 [Trema orientale]|uniref:Uncharacterized protein n=1 Tax=Trema orientale TaxID=63057 RepID=A0A2P5FRP5_TREOI|nr:hypothetical protein TorRG33x02_035590 [Trema orientale]